MEVTHMEVKTYSYENSVKMVERTIRIVGRTLSLTYPDRDEDVVKWVTDAEAMISLWKASDIDYVLLAEQQSDLVVICLEELLIYSAELINKGGLYE